jgi:hypothetical protein
LDSSVVRAESSRRLFLFGYGSNRGVGYLRTVTVTCLTCGNQRTDDESNTLVTIPRAKGAQNAAKYHCGVCGTKASVYNQKKFTSKPVGWGDSVKRYGEWKSAPAKSDRPVPTKKNPIYLNVDGEKIPYWVEPYTTKTGKGRKVSAYSLSHIEMSRGTLLEGLPRVSGQSCPTEAKAMEELESVIKHLHPVWEEPKPTMTLVVAPRHPQIDPQDMMDAAFCNDNFIEPTLTEEDKKLFGVENADKTEEAV